jgi:hypothetical protein
MNERKSTARAGVGGATIAAVVLLAAIASATSASAQRAVPWRNMQTNMPTNMQSATATAAPAQPATRHASLSGAKTTSQPSAQR